MLRFGGININPSLSASANPALLTFPRSRREILAPCLGIKGGYGEVGLKSDLSSASAKINLAPKHRFSSATKIVHVSTEEAKIPS